MIRNHPLAMVSRGYYLVRPREEIPILQMSVGARFHRLGLGLAIYSFLCVKLPTPPKKLWGGIDLAKIFHIQFLKVNVSDSMIIHETTVARLLVRICPTILFDSDRRRRGRPKEVRKERRHSRGSGSNLIGW